jgi:trans-aconitate methyltransferase
MRNPANPFTDPGQVRGHLYVSAGRLARRTSALHRARVRGRHAAEVIADLAAGAAVTSAPVIADIGCGRGTTTCLLAGRLPQARIIAIDLSAALLTTVRNRLPAAARAGAARADFHRLPIRDGACDLAVAAFCLYHSRSPGQVIGEIARCLAQGTTTVIAVKSEDSYRELDLLMAASGLDPHAPGRPSLYETAHSGNIEHLATASLDVRQVVHDTHAFTFPAPDGEHLMFEHVNGRHARPEDLPLLAASLGDMDGDAHARELHQARLPQRYPTRAGHTLPGFPDGRIDAVARELRSGRVRDARLTVHQAQELITGAVGPAAFYKDANPRNFLITPEGTLVTIDFDDLTLAPFGYDLAKLIVTLAMTHGPIPAASIVAALISYNKAASRHSRSLPGVTWEELTGWAEIHHILTSRYADDGRYPCRWDQARPGPAPEEASPWP